MDKIKHFVECLLPITLCNIECSYCYVIQREKRKMKTANLKYSTDQIERALKKERWGGACYFSICGAGETTMQPELPDIVYAMLKNGHYVNITTNGTCTAQIAKIITQCEPYCKHLHFSFSFHYIELKKRGWINRFFENIKFVKDRGASFVLQINLCDAYLPYLKEIKTLCIQMVGAMPQVAATRAEEKSLQHIELLTELSNEQYMVYGNEFESPLFDFTMKNFNVERKEFCYAGAWSANLDLSTGIMRRCYASYISQNVFANPKKEIHWHAIGTHCNSSFCMNSSHFIALGVMPTYNAPSYCELRNRSSAGWYTPEMMRFLSQKLYDNNNKYSKEQILLSDILGLVDTAVAKLYPTVKKVIKTKTKW